jgi:uncharacterized membrane protein YdjX (TVP38/TMEM64 family)
VAANNISMTRAARLRLIILCVLISLFAAGITVILLHPQARVLLSNPHHLGHAVRAWTHQHGLLAELVLLALYILLTLIAMPVWWLNVLAGYSFGLIGGTVRCVIIAAIAATVTAELWKWLAADIADHKLIPHIRILQALKRYSTDGGFLVVLVTRLAHLLPFGLSNYIFGMLGIRWPAVLGGTLIGNIPAAAIYVSLGAGREWRSHPAFVITISICAIGGLFWGAIIYARHRRSHIPKL